MAAIVCVASLAAMKELPEFEMISMLGQYLAADSALCLKDGQGEERLVAELLGGKEYIFIGNSEEQKETLILNENKELYEVAKENENPLLGDVETPKGQTVSNPQILPVPRQKNEIVEKEKITVDDFARVEMRVGTVVACEAVKKSRLLHETVKVGSKTLSVLSGIANHYTPEEMVGKKVIVVCNLPPREMKGILSEGMIVCAEAPDGTLSLISPEKDVPDGSEIG